MPGNIPPPRALGGPSPFARPSAGSLVARPSLTAHDGDGGTPGGAAAAAAAGGPTTTGFSRPSFKRPSLTNATLDRLCSSVRGHLQLEFMKEVHGLQTELALVGDHPLLALAEVAELLVKRLDVDLAAIYVMSKGHGPQCSVLLGAHGLGAPDLAAARLVVPCGAGDDNLMTGDRVTGGDIIDGLAEGPKLGLAECWSADDRDTALASGVPSALWDGPASLRSFHQVLIGNKGNTHGVLLLAKQDPQPFESSGWQLRLHIHMASAGLLPHVRHSQVSMMVGLLRALWATQEPVELIGLLLQHASQYMLKACSMRMSVRLALLLRAPNMADEALLFENRGAAGLSSAAAAASRSGGGGAGGSLDTSGPPAAPSRGRRGSSLDSSLEGGVPGIVASVLPLQNTLLASAVDQMQARFISDCGHYMKTCIRPARDIFGRSSGLVSSVVVLPLIFGDDAPLGALYFVADTPCHFQHIQDTLVGFIQGVTPLLFTRLAGQDQALAAVVERARRPSSFSTGPLSDYRASFDYASSGVQPPPGAYPPRAPSPAPSSLAASIQRAPSPAPATAGGPGGSAAGANGSLVELQSVSGSLSETVQQSMQQQAPHPGLVAQVSVGRRANMDAMLQVFQHELRSKSRQSRAHLARCASELSFGPCLGRGGFGVVYRGLWHNVPVAIKVMKSRQSEREAIQDAVEMAVLSSVHHPNIVTVYSCMTDMVEVSDADASNNGLAPLPSSLGSQASFGRTPSGQDISSINGASSTTLGSIGGGRGQARYRRLGPQEEPLPLTPTYNLVVMEFCDHGTLRDAVESGAFHRRLPNGFIGVQLAPAVEVLLDVAYAMHYLHSSQLLHGDIKMENILLKSDQSRRLGFTPKLADFGLTKMLNDGDHVFNIEGAGTVTHLAPEMFKVGSNITTAVDVYAFGILVWEFYTGKRAYAGLSREAIVERVRSGHMRPHFPSATPPKLKAIAEACWHSSPSARPSFSEISDHLEQFLALDLAPPPPSGAAPAAAAAALSAGALPARPAAVVASAGH